MRQAEFLRRICVRSATFASTQAIVLLAFGLAGCQAVSGLNKLEADRTGSATAAGAAADGVRGGATRATSGSSAGARAGAGTPQRADVLGAAGTGGRAGASASAAGSHSDADSDADAGVGECVTRITYGSAWIRPANHTGEDWDQVSGMVTWDGSCEVDAAGNSFAQLSNGWRPYFTGHNGCVLALDVQGSCVPVTGCSTRVHYGASWLHPDGHGDPFDDVPGVITTNAHCNADGDQSYVVLSNGWQPHFKGKDSCAFSLRYSQCGGLFANPVVDTDCPDPSVLHDGDKYVMACTAAEGGENPLRTSQDLVHWKLEGSIFTQDTKPQWANRDFWAPELQRVGDQYVAYFSARHTDGDLAIGVATAATVLGPYRDRGEPLLRDSHGAIDVHPFEAPDGTRYLLWKVDGNAHGSPTPIMIQPLTADGLTLTGSATTLLTNTEPWEANVIEGPWLVYESGQYYLFYSGNSYASAGYALGVARSTSVTGPYTKAREPLVISSGRWAGPGHGSAVRTPAEDWVFVFHAWVAGRIGQSPPGRQVLLTRIGWADGWPTMLGAPSSVSQPIP